MSKKISKKNLFNNSLYLVTDRSKKTKEEFFKIIEEAILGGVSIVQIREKTSPTKEFYEIAKKVKKITDKYDIPLIINDRLDIALAIEASGVHVGQEDIPVNKIRKIIGNEKILGVSATTSQLAINAEKYGADYIGSGAIYPTKTKDSDCISINELKKIVDAVNIPIIAIGGLSENNIDILKNSGIKGVSIVSAIMNSKNPKITSFNLKRKLENLQDI